MRITGEPGGPPTKVGSPVTDINAGILAALGILAAYVHRLRTGRGQLVDTSLLEAGVMQTFWQSAIFLGSGREIGPARVGASADRAVPGLRNAGRLDHHRRLQPGQLRAPGAGARGARAGPRRAVSRQRSAHGASGRSGRADRRLPAAQAVISVACGADCGGRSRRAGPDGGRNAVASASACARHGRRDSASQGRQTSSAIGCPIKLSETPTRVSRTAPFFGQHTREVLEECGLSGAEVDALISARAAIQG